MAQHAFQEQLVSIMEILAKAAVAEINRRVDDSCAVIRLELSRSQRDIDTLKRKCQVMENELRKASVRGRRKVLLCRTSEKLPVPYPSVWVRETGTDVCRTELTDDPQEADPGQSAQEVQEILEVTPKIPVIKEEGIECETWNSGEVSPCENRENLSQETSEEQNQLHEDRERTSAHFACMLSLSDPVRSNKEGLNKMGLQVKEEREQENMKEIEIEDDVEGSEQKMGETGDHLEYAHRDSQLWATNQEQEHDGEAEWIEKSFTSAQLSQELGAFSQSVDTAAENCEDDTQMYNAGQVMAQKQLQASWCRERPSTSAGKGLNMQLSTQRQLGSPLRTREGILGASVVAQTGCDTAAPALGYSRSGLGSMRRLRTHWCTNVAGERRFSCSFCEKRFVRFGQLKEHLRSHTGERPYTCAQCGSSFTKQGNLIRHAVVHSGEKPYQCNLCGKCFTQRSSLKSHQKTHMPEREDALQGFPVSGNTLVITQSRNVV